MISTPNSCSLAIIFGFRPSRDSISLRQSPAIDAASGSISSPSRCIDIPSQTAETSMPGTNRSDGCCSAHPAASARPAVVS